MMILGRKGGSASDDVAVVEQWWWRLGKGWAADWLVLPLECGEYLNQAADNC